MSAAPTISCYHSVSPISASLSPLHDNKARSAAIPPESPPLPSYSNGQRCVDEKKKNKKKEKKKKKRAAFVSRGNWDANS